MTLGCGCRSTSNSRSRIGSQSFGRSSALRPESTRRMSSSDSPVVCKNSTTCGVTLVSSQITSSFGCLSGSVLANCSSRIWSFFEPGAEHDPLALTTGR